MSVGAITLSVPMPTDPEKRLRAGLDLADRMMDHVIAKKRGEFLQALHDTHASEEDRASALDWFEGECEAMREQARATMRAALQVTAESSTVH